jgi:cytochrome c556
MVSFAQAIPLPLPRTILVIGTVVSAVIGMSLIASGQDQTTATAKDAIFARKILMDTISRNMDELETMTSSQKAIDLTEGREHADNISIMLMAFPHLFPPVTNQWTPSADRDPGSDTYAAPDLWTHYPDFYAKAARASKTAYNASRSKQDGEFKTYVAELRTACDGCHAAYLKTDQ